MQPDLIARIEAAQPSEARELFLIAFHSAFPDIDDEASQQWFSLMDKLLGRIHAQDYLDAAARDAEDRWQFDRLVLWLSKEEPTPFDAPALEQAA